MPYRYVGPHENEHPYPAFTPAITRMLATVSIAFVVTQFDVTIVTIALPSIGAQLHAAVSELQWIGDAYTLAFSA